jgi:hypothetical protein
MNTTYYQPKWYKDDGTNIEYGGLPDELYSFQVFKTREGACNWLIQHGYDPDNFNIAEYHNDDIEEPTFIDEYGDKYEKIEDVDDDTLLDLIVDRVVLDAGGVDNLPLTRQNQETDQEREDRLYTEAHSAVMNAIGSIENDDEFDFSAYWDCNSDGEAWYDSVREDAIRKVLGLMTGQGD